MRRRSHGLLYCRIPKGLPNAGKLVLTVDGHHYLYRSLRDMLGDYPIIEKALHGQKTLFSFEE